METLLGGASRKEANKHIGWRLGALIGHSENLKSYSDSR